MLKIFISCLFVVLFSASAAGTTFERFEIIEISPKAQATNGEKKQFLEKNKNVKKYGIIFSGKSYNEASKSIIIAPVVLKNEKSYTGKFVFHFKSGLKGYIIFSDKLRLIEKEKVIKTSIKLTEQEKEAVNKLFNNILN